MTVVSKNNLTITSIEIVTLCKKFVLYILVIRTCDNFQLFFFLIWDLLKYIDHMTHDVEQKNRDLYLFVLLLHGRIAVVRFRVFD